MRPVDADWGKVFIGEWVVLLFLFFERILRRQLTVTGWRVHLEETGENVIILKLTEREREKEREREREGERERILTLALFRAAGVELNSPLLR